MVDRDDAIAYIQKQEWFQNLVEQRAHQLIDELFSEPERTSSAVETTTSSVVDPSTTPEHSKHFKHGNTSLTAEERRDINAWISQKEGTKRTPSQFVRSDYIAAYFARNTE